MLPSVHMTSEVHETGSIPFSILLILAASSTLSLNMILPSLESISRDFNATNSSVSSTFAGYLVVSAIAQLISGPLSDRVGRRPVILAALLLNTGASFGCAFSSNLAGFILLRMVQGVAIVGFAISITTIRDMYSQRQTSCLIGYVGAATSVALLLGPAVGGFINDAVGWRCVFLLQALFGLILTWVCFLHFQETRSSRCEAQNKLLPNLRDLSVTPAFLGLAWSTAFATSSFYIFISGAPIILSMKFRLEPTEIGLVLGSISTGLLIGGLISGQIGMRCDPMRLLLLGGAFSTLSLLFSLVISFFFSTNIFLLGSTAALVGLGNGILIPSSNAAAMSIRPDLAGSAASLVGTLVLIVGAILTSVSGHALGLESSVDLLFLFMLGASAMSLLASLFVGKIPESENSHQITKSLY